MFWTEYSCADALTPYVMVFGAGRWLRLYEVMRVRPLDMMNVLVRRNQNPLSAMWGHSMRGDIYKPGCPYQRTESASTRTVRRKYLFLKSPSFFFCFVFFKSPSFVVATPADRDCPLIFIIPFCLSYAAWFNLGWHWAHLTDYFLTSAEDTCDHKMNKIYARVLIRTSGYTLSKVHRKKKEIYKYRYR